MLGFESIAVPDVVTAVAVAAGLEPGADDCSKPPKDRATVEWVK